MPGRCQEFLCVLPGGRHMTGMKVIGAMLVAGFVGAVQIVAALDPRNTFDPPLLLSLLNMLILGIVPVVAAYVASSTYVKGRSASVLFMGCGMLAYGVGNLTAGWVAGLAWKSAAMAIHDLGTLVGAVCNIVGGILYFTSTVGRLDSRLRTRTAALAYLGIVALVLCFSLVSVRGWVPRFFIEGEGPTGLRHAILGTGVVLFLCSGTLFLAHSFRRKSDFLYWYALALGMIGLGLATTFLQKAVGSPMEWLVRTGQYIGALLAFYAMWVALRGARSRRMSLDAIMADFFADVDAGYRALVEGATDAIATFDDEGRIISWNPAATKMFGRTSPDAVGSSFYDILVPDKFREVIATKIEASLASNPDPSDDGVLGIECFRNDGGIFPAEISLSVKPTPYGWVCVCFIRDVTARKQVEAQIRALNEMLEERVDERTAALAREIDERKRTEQELRESEQKFRSLFENSMDAILLVRPSDGAVFAANPAACTMFGRSEGAIWQGGQGALVDPNDPRLSAFVEERTRTGRAVSELSCIRGDGTTFPAEISESIFSDADGNERSILVVRDITERKLVEEVGRKALETADILDKIFSTTHFCIAFLDQDYYFIRVNQAYAEACGYAPEFFPGKNHFDLYPHEENEAIFRHVVETGETFTIYAKPFEFPDRPDRGITYWDWTLHPVKDAKGRVEGLIFVLLDVTERKLAEEKLRQSEQTLRTVVRVAPVGIGMTVNGIFRWTNEALCSIAGCSPEELLGQDGRTLFENDDEFDRVNAHQLADIVADGSGAIETRWRCRDGSVKDILLRSAAIEPGCLSTGIVFTALDITERKRSDEEQAAAAKEIEDLYNNAPCGYHSLDQDGLFVRVNDTELSWLGYTRDELVGKKKFGDVITGESLDVFENNFPVLKDRGWVRDLEFNMIRKNGTILPVLLNSTAVKDASGTFFMSRSTMFDITHRKRAEHRLRESEERFRKIFEQGPLGMAIVGLDYRLMTLNPAFSKITGYRNEDLGSLTFMDITYPDDVQADLEQAGRLLSGEISHYAIEKRYVRKTGEIVWGNLTRSIVRDSDGNPLYFLGMVEDITKRKQMQELLHERAEELALSNADLEQFAYVASHDLQEPLRNVASCVQLLQKQYKNRLGPDADQYIHHAIESVLKMKTLIHDLLAYSRVGTQGKLLALTDCEQIIDKTLKNLSTAIRESGATITHDPLPTLSADDSQLLQVFQNLLENAIKFRREEPLRIHVSAERYWNGWMFSVKDNGIGIESQHLDRIFVLFQRLHKRGKYAGTGIGLAIVKKIIDRHRGRIMVESEPDIGTTFYFTIPDRETGI